MSKKRSLPRSLMSLAEGGCSFLRRFGAGHCQTNSSWRCCSCCPFCWLATNENEISVPHLRHCVIDHLICVFVFVVHFKNQCIFPWTEMMLVYDGHRSSLKGMIFMIIIIIYQLLKKEQSRSRANLSQQSSFPLPFTADKFSLSLSLPLSLSPSLSSFWLPFALWFDLIFFAGCAYPGIIVIQIGGFTRIPWVADALLPQRALPQHTSSYPAATAAAIKSGRIFNEDANSSAALHFSDAITADP